MIIGVLKEKAPETRVSLVPEMVRSLAGLKVEVWMEPDAGGKAFYPDDLYREAGALLQSAERIAAEADVILAMHADTMPEDLPEGKVLIGTYQPLFHPRRMEEWLDRKHTVFSLDMIPRTTRAQAMDVLSSQANIAGYKSVLLAAGVYARYFPMFMTAAGSIPPARMLVLGAGVAGLQAVATGRRLGAAVSVFDTRPAVKEEVMSLGAKFIEVEGAADAAAAGGYAVEQSEEFRQKQKAEIHTQIGKADIVITTAQIPGKKAPVLITTPMIESMRPGSVIVDLAAATGGNTELTRNNETIIHKGVTIIGNSALAATMPADASKLYSKNVFNFLKLIINPEGGLNLNFEDELVKGTAVGNKVLS